MLITINTVIAIVIDDLKSIWLPKEADSYVDILLIFCLCTFVIEILLSIIAINNYKLSFFFWLDLIGVGYLCLDIAISLLLHAGEEEETKIELPHTTTAFTEIVHASRSSKVGSKAGRFIKLIRIVRVMRLAKLYRQTKTVISKRENLIAISKERRKSILGP